MDLGKYFTKRKIIGKENIRINIIFFLLIELNIYDPMKMKILVHDAIFDTFEFYLINVSNKTV